MPDSERFWRLELSGGTDERAIYEYPVIHINLLERMLIEIGFLRIECPKYEEQGKKQTMRVEAWSVNNDVPNVHHCQTVGTVRCYEAADHVHDDQIQQVLAAIGTEKIS